VKRFYPVKYVMALLGYTREGLRYKELHEPDFPQRIKVGPGQGGRVVYDADEFDAWLASRRGKVA
jgi:predicted DNA-binding transcriptional regulator AlpA